MPRFPVAQLIVAMIVMLAACTDLRSRRIPNRLTFRAFVPDWH